MKAIEQYSLAVSPVLSPVLLFILLYKVDLMK